MSHTRRIACNRLLVLTLLGALALSSSLPASEPDRESDRESDRDVAAFARHLEETVPALLVESGVPGAAVAVVHGGRTAYLSGFGLADRETGVRVGPDTMFNVGSISKTITAWGVLSLVDAGRLGLDSPVASLLDTWPLAETAPPPAMTVRNLLDHTGGLSTPSVPEYLPWEPIPSLTSWLGTSGEVHLASTPGTTWAYSGAGYSLLQLAVESASGMPFEDYFQESILEPLGMTASTFLQRHSGHPLARPHEEGRQIPYRRYSGLAAAGLFTSARDLGLFLEAHSNVGGLPAGREVVSPDSLTLLRTANPLSTSPYNTSYGLGYSIWPLSSSRPTSGHRGQNHGWSAVLWLSTDGSDGLAVLTNDSEGEEVYRWIFCDWARWLDGSPSFGGYCRGRSEHPTGTLFAAEPVEESRLQHRLQRHIQDGVPGIAAIVAREGRLLLRRGVGLADIERRTGIEPTTPFYIASLAKPLTASVVLDLVADGVLALDDPVRAWLPELTALTDATTVRHLLTHTSGVPDLWDVFDWSRPTPLDNLEVFRLVSDSVTGPRFDPGSRYEYSNTGYMALASLSERVTGRPFESLLVDMWPCADSSSELYLLDDAETDLPQRARGYGVRNSELRLVDYRRLELPGLRPVEPGFSLVGAGGVVSNVDGLLCWAQSLLRGDLLPGETGRLALEATRDVPEVTGIGERTRVGPMFFEATLAGHRLLWYDGALFGHRSLLVIEPASETIVVLLANSSEIDLHPLAQDLLLQALEE